MFSSLILRTRVLGAVSSIDDATLPNLFVALLKDFSLNNTILVIRDRSNKIHAYFPPASCLLFDKMKKKKAVEKWPIFDSSVIS